MTYERDEEAISAEFGQGAKQGFYRSSATIVPASPPGCCHSGPHGTDEPETCCHVHAEDLPVNRHLDEVPRDFYEKLLGWTAQD